MRKKELIPKSTSRIDIAPLQSMEELEVKVKFFALAAAVLLATGLFAGTTLVSAKSGEQNGDSLSIVQARGGAYVIVTELTADNLSFNYGWNNVDAFESEPVGYWIGVYDRTALHYVWATDNPLTPTPKLLKLRSLDETTMVSGHNYEIHFYVRDSYGPPATNVTLLEVFFTAP